MHAFLQYSRLHRRLRGQRAVAANAGLFSAVNTGPAPLRRKFLPVLYTRSFEVPSENNAIISSRDILFTTRRSQKLISTLISSLSPNIMVYRLAQRHQHRACICSPMSGLQSIREISKNPGPSFSTSHKYLCPILCQRY